MLPYQQLSSNRRADSRLSAVEEWGREIVEALLASCHPQQRQFVEDPHRRVSALVGRGGGKTTAFKAKALCKLVTARRARIAYLAMSRPHAEELLWEPLKHTCDELNLVVGKDVLLNETKLKLTILRTGGEIKLLGADDSKEVEKLRGRPFHLVGLDEAASHKNELVEALLHRIVGPRLGDYGGSFLLFGTPGHLLTGEFYDATVPGGQRHRPYELRERPEYASWLSWSSHSWALDDPAAQEIPALRNLWAEAIITKRDNQWSDEHPIWQREYLGHWAADDTDTIFKFRPAVNEWSPHGSSKPDGLLSLKAAKAALPPRPDWSYAFGFDMGHSDPFCLQVFAYSPSDPSRTIYHVYEFEQTQMYARLIAQLLLGTDADSPTGCQSHDSPTGVLGVTGWPDGMVADLTHLGGAVLDELRNVYGIAIGAAEQKPGQRFATVELFNGDLVDGRLKILKGSRLAEQLASLQWTQDEFGQLRWPKGRPDHATDAAIYCRRLIAKLFELSAPPVSATRQPEPEPFSSSAGGETENYGDFDEDYFGL